MCDYQTTLFEKPIEDKIELNLEEDAEKVFSSFSKDFCRLKKEGLKSSHRSKSTGIGKTFEDIIGIEENNNHLADYQGILEIKSQREYSQSMVTLFTKSPTYPCGYNSKLREKYGYPDEKVPQYNSLHTTVNSKKYNNVKSKWGFKLDIVEEEEKIYLRIKDLKNDKQLDEEIFYSYRELKERFDEKCRYIAYISAKTEKENGIEFFHFDQATLLSGLSFEGFIEAIKAEMICYDIRLGIYRKGKNKGKHHDHGSGFRIKKNAIKKLFSVTNLENLVIK